MLMFMPAAHRDVPLWDIYEEHLDEAAFLWTQRERSLTALAITLDGVAAGPEARMLAHVDALVAGGPPVAEGLLLAGLADEEPDKVSAAAFALFSSEGPGIEAVFRALTDAPPERRPPLVRAAMLAPGSEVGPRLAALLPKVEPALQAVLLDALAFRRFDPGIGLDSLCASGETVLRCAALRAARFFPGHLGTHLIEEALRSLHAGERKEALETGLVLGMKSARPACERLLSEFTEGWNDPALLWALSGDPNIAPLLEALKKAKWRKGATWALGFTGRLEAADALRELIADEDLGPLAAESFATITGLPVAAPFFGPRPDEDDLLLDEESELPTEVELPWPVEDLIGAWWREARRRFDPSVRYLRGVPFGFEPLMGALADGIMRRRPPLALELAIRTRGGCFVTADALTDRQRQELALARAGTARFQSVSHP